MSLLGGQMQFACSNLGALLAHFRSGALRPLMTTTREPLKDCPTARRREVSGGRRWKASQHGRRWPDLRACRATSSSAGQTCWRSSRAIPRGSQVSRKLAAYPRCAALRKQTSSYATVSALRAARRTPGPASVAPVLRITARKSGGGYSEVRIWMTIHIRFEAAFPVQDCAR